jgi:hypothetical protein
MTAGWAVLTAGLTCGFRGVQGATAHELIAVKSQALVYSQLFKPWVSHQDAPQHPFFTLQSFGQQLDDLGLVTDHFPGCRKVVAGWLLLAYRLLHNTLDFDTSERPPVGLVIKQSALLVPYRKSVRRGSALDCSLSNTGSA